MGAAVLDLDFERLPPRIDGLNAYDRALVLLRLGGLPAGQAWIPLFRDSLDAAELERECLLGADSAFWEALARRRLGLVEAPAGPALPTTIAVCTRDRPDDLRRCLDALVRLPDDGQEILVVDNHPRTDATRSLVARYPGARYVREERPGLDVARNRALREARFPVVAFTDDDAAPDPLWLRGLRRHFDDERVFAATGLTLPLELETEAQLCYQRLGGLGRGMKPFVLEGAGADPFVGWTAGAGVNMALRRDVIERVGPFDEALDVGTPTAGGGDSDMFRRILAAGCRIVYDPTALNWHRHRREWADVRRQFYGYDSAGHAIWARSFLLEGEVDALRHAWAWLWRELKSLSVALIGTPAATPLPLVLARMRGALVGPWVYFRARTRLRAAAPPASVRPNRGGEPPGPAPVPWVGATPPTGVDGSDTMVSVVVPTHDRMASLRRLLDALCRQTWPAGRMEVIVVCDAATDGTADMVRAFTAPFPLRVLERDHGGPGAARNAGAAVAAGEILLFLDDDVEPEPGLVAAHAAAHEGGERRVVIGPYPPAQVSRPGLFQLQGWRWWDARFRDMARPGHRFAYRDLLGGNVSLPGALFREVGGFDPAFVQCREDGELGIRLLGAGAEFGFSAAARARHHDHETTDLRKSLRRAWAEGRFDIQLCERHPHVSLSVDAAYIKVPGATGRRLACLLLSATVRAGRIATPALLATLAVLERLRLRRPWYRLYGALRKCHYWVGALDAAGGAKALAAFQRAAGKPTRSVPPVLDLAAGIGPAERRLDAERPRVVRLVYGRHDVGTVADRPYEEPLRGRHLRELVAGRYARPYVEALVLSGVIVAGGEPDPLMLLRSVRDRAWWFGPLDPAHMWSEQYHQWRRLLQRLAAGPGADPATALELERIRVELLRAEADRLVTAAGPDP